MSNTNLYIIGASSGPVKIGISGAASVRLRQLQTGYPHRLEIIAEVAGDEEDEEYVHNFLQQWRLEGEWFERSAEVERFCGLLRQNIPIRTALRRLQDRRDMVVEIPRRAKRKPIKPSAMIRLAAVDGRRIRGFKTNVSNIK